METISFFLPTRAGSERVINKNTKPFAGVEGGLLKIKINQLLKVNRVDKIVVSTNDDETKKVISAIQSPKILLIDRPGHLCLSSTNLQDLIDYVPTVVDSDHIFWVHVTSPLIDNVDYDLAIDTYFDLCTGNAKYDSLVSVTKVQQFLWDKDKNGFISHDREVIKWPRTQDLKVFYDINSAMFINSRNNYLHYNDRIGQTPYMYEIDKIKSQDVDWPEDFEIAEYFYKREK